MPSQWRLTLVVALASGCADGTGPRPSLPKAGQVIYSQWRWRDTTVPPHYRIYRVRPDGSDLTPILTAQSDFASELALSPDGLSLAFVERGGLSVARLDGGGKVTFPALTSPRWDPSGRRRIVAHDRGQLYMVDLDRGDPPAPILDTRYTGAFPNWISDRAQILFFGRQKGGPGGLFRLDLASGTTERAYDRNWGVYGGTYLYSFLRISPDMRWVSYSAYEPTYPDGSPAPDGAWVMDLHSGDAEWIGGNSLYSCPCPWSPDSRSLIFAEYDSIASRLVVLDFGTRARRYLTDDDGMLEDDPDWVQ